MAHFRKLVSGRWQVCIRRKGHQPISSTFASRLEGDKWARQIEADMDRGAYMPIAPAQEVTIGELIDRYIAEVSIHKRSARSDIQRLRYLKSHFGKLSLSSLRSGHVSQWRDRRIAEGKSGSTVVKEIGSLSHLVDVAIKDWNISLPSNPVKLVRKPKVPRGRDRRIRQEELIALQSTRISPIVTLAIETGMRLGELLSLDWRLIDLEARVAVLPMTKNGEKRVVPLSLLAVSTLNAIQRHGERVFSQWRSVFSFENAWRRTLQRLRLANPNPAFLTDLRFHDLRHEAASRLFEKGLGLMEVSAIIGHKSPQMLWRYTHLRAEELALKLG